jgi:hypothetical protein
MKNIKTHDELITQLKTDGSISVIFMEKISGDLKNALTEQSSLRKFYPLKIQTFTRSDALVTAFMHTLGKSFHRREIKDSKKLYSYSIWHCAIYPHTKVKPLSTVKRV